MEGGVSQVDMPRASHQLNPALPTLYGWSLVVTSAS